MGKDKIIKYLKNEHQEQKFNRISFSNLRCNYHIIIFTAIFSKFLSSGYHLKQKKFTLNICLSILFHDMWNLWYWSVKNLLVQIWKSFRIECVFSITFSLFLSNFLIAYILQFRRSWKLLNMFLFFFRINLKCSTLSGLVVFPLRLKIDIFPFQREKTKLRRSEAIIIIQHIPFFILNVFLPMIFSSYFYI